MSTNLNRRVLSLIIQLVYFNPQLNLPREFGPPVGEGARLRQLLLLDLPTAATATKPGRAVAPHFDGQRTFCGTMDNI